MANLKGYVPLPDPNWITLEFDDGSMSNPVQDPTGDYRKQVDEISRKIKGIPPDPMANATASLGGAVLGEAAEAGAGMAKVATDAAPMGAVRAPIVAPPPSPVAAAPAGGMGMAPGIVKTAIKGGAEQPAEAAPGAQAPAPAAAPAPPAPPTSSPLVTTGTTSSWQKNESRQTTGMVDEDKAKVDAANEATAVAAEKANTEDYVAKATQYWTEFGRLSEQAKKQVAERAVLQEQEARFNESLNSAYKKLDETAARPVDPSQAFAGEKGWYAFMAGFGDVLRNVGAALAGKGPVADPGATLNALVERSVELQMAQKKADYEQGKISVDRLTADRETTRHKLGVVLQQLAATELGKAKTQEEYQALGALKAKGDAIVADARAKAAAATARQETTGTTISQGGSTTKGPAAAAGGGIDDFSKRLATRKAYEESGATPEQLAAYDKVYGVPSPGGKSATAIDREKSGDLTEAQGKAQAAASAISTFATKAGLVRDPKTGKWKTGEGLLPPALLEKANPLSDNEINASFEAAVEAYGRMQSGGVIGAEERPAFREQLGEKTLTRAQLAARLNAAEVTLEGRQAGRAKEERTAPKAWK